MKAYITLVTNDTYAPGALVLAHRLRDMGTLYDIVCLVTHQVSNHVRTLLRDHCYTQLVDVQELFTTRFENLLLLGRPELGATLTKIQLWGLTQYTKLVFLDADTFPIRNIDDLFLRPAFAAAPDTGWPDCFNSGVFVAEPSDSIYQGLIRMAADKGSFDGGDQGLLNSFFCNWPETSQHRLAFTYNTTPSAAYSYLPAYREFKQKIAVIHFIGKEKPWHAQRFADGSLFKPTGMDNEFLQLWWDTWDKHYGKHVSPTTLINPVNTSPFHHYDYISSSSSSSQQTIAWDKIKIQNSTAAKNNADAILMLSSTSNTVKNSQHIKQKDIPKKSIPATTNTLQGDHISSKGLNSGELPHYTFLQSSTFTEATMLEFELDHRARNDK